MFLNGFMWCASSLLDDLRGEKVFSEGVHEGPSAAEPQANEKMATTKDTKLTKGMI